MQLLGDAMPVLLAIGLVACVGVLAALVALRQTGRPALVWTALGVTAAAAAFTAVATQRPGGGAVAGPATVAAVPVGPTPPPVGPRTPPGTTSAPSTPAPGPSAAPPVRTTTDAATRRANRHSFRSGVLARFAAPVIGAAQTCQGEEPAGGEREVVACYLGGDHQVRYLRWGTVADRDRQRRQFDVRPGVPSRWAGPDGVWAGALRAAVHHGIEGDYAKVYWDLECEPVGAVLYGPSSAAASLPDVRRYWQDVVLGTDPAC